MKNEIISTLLEDYSKLSSETEAFSIISFFRKDTNEKLLQVGSVAVIEDSILPSVKYQSTFRIYIKLNPGRVYYLDLYLSNNILSIYLVRNDCNMLLSLLKIPLSIIEKHTFLNLPRMSIKDISDFLISILNK